MGTIRDTFKDPGTEFRGAPFWAWNARLEKGELLRQVEDMKQHGLGGFFMHSRVGLETPYMQEEFLDLIQAVVERSAELGMKAYLYDEDRWPSGFAGGEVPKAGRGDEFRNKFLAMQKKSGADGEGAVLAEHAVSADEKGRIAEDSGTKDIYLFTERVCAPCRWFNGDTYSDNMNPECVRTFIEVTYERYRKRVGDHFGETIPGIFTDEPNVLLHPGDLTSGTRILPWTAGLPARFENDFGYSIIDKLPYLFFEGEGSRKIRHDYWNTVSNLFAESYTKQLGEWCGKNGIALTGHMLCEGSIEEQIRLCGSIMPHYEYMQYPGIDILREKITENLTVKQCSSVMHQFGRKRLLSELYGCCGWGFTFEGQKWLGDWQMALGVNLRCQHLTWYTMKGSAKRDYPPCFNYQHPMWEHYPIIEDYFARLSYILSQGEAKIDVLLIHPVRSGWAYMSDSPPEEVNKIENELNRTMDILLGGHIDFDFGDETIMARHGSIAEDGKFSVNKASYSTVIIPPSYTLSKDTLDLLREFADRGGRVIALGQLPYMIDGEDSEELQQFFKREDVAVCANSKRELLFALRQGYEPDVLIVNEDGRDIEPVIFQMREIEDTTFVFMANRDRTAGYAGVLKVKGRGGAEEWDLKTGGITSAGSLEEGEYVSIPFDMPASGSKLFTVSDKTEPLSPSDSGSTPDRVIRLSDTWEHKRVHPNGLPIDFCRYRIDGGEWSERMMVLRAHTEIMKELGIFRDIESRWVYLLESKDVDRRVEVQAEFEVQDIPETIFLAMEEAREARVMINGREVPAFDGWYMDRALSKTDISGLIEKGINTVDIAWDFRDGMQIEEFYILGDFGVDQARRIVAEPLSLDGGDWCTQGYPFYSGAMKYVRNTALEKKEETSYILQLNGYKGVTACVRINGKEAGDLSWPPFSLDITPYIQDGDNSVEIEIIGSPRNLLGPNHNTDRYPVWTGPGQFVTEGDDFTEEYMIVPHGLNRHVTITLYVCA